MKRSILEKITLGVLATSVASWSLPVSAEAKPQAQAGDFQSLDQDGNQILSRREVRSGAELVLRNWDVDEDGKFNEAELTEAFFQLWDTDGDEALSQAEIEVGRMLWVPTRRRSKDLSFDDADGETIDHKAFQEKLSKTRWFRKYDRNGSGRISQNEMTRTMMKAFDENRDGRLSENEWPVVGELDESSQS